MKVVILAGGLGTRLAEETVVKPKPMVEIGGMPIIWHIMKIYSAHGFNDFIICLGYKGYLIKEYFSNYFMHMSDITINLKDNTLEVHDTQAEPWKITLVETGTHSMTGGRIKRIKNYIGNKAFMLTYGDGVADIDVNQLVAFHQQQQNCVTITSVQPSGRFGALHINDDDQVVSFTEKPRGDGNWINGGYFVCEPQIFDFIEGDLTSWEREPLEAIAKDGKMKAYKHNGFWKAMDTLRDKLDLEEAWEKNQAPWKIW